MNPTGPKITSSGTFDCGISDHHIMYATTNIYLHRRNASKTITVYKLENPEALKKDFECIPWHFLDIFDDVDDTAYLWQTLYCETIKNHLKVQKLKKRVENKPWINKQIRKELNKRYKLLLKAKRTTDPNNWSTYKIQRNKCKRQLQAAEAEYWKNKFEKCDSTKSFWRAVNMYQGKFSSKNIGTIVKDDVRYTSDADKANVLNTHFASVGTIHMWSTNSL